MNYIWKIKYDTLAILDDGRKGNVSQGMGIAYIDCEFDDIREHLEKHLSKSKKFPLIKEVTKELGEIVPVVQEPVEYKPSM